LKSTPPFQFSITTAFCTITTVGILCAIGRFETYSSLSLFPAVFLVASCWVARRHKSSDLAWSLFTIAWLIALINGAGCLVGAFSINGGGGPSVFEMQRRFMIAYVSKLSLPGFLSIPAAYLAIQHSKFPPSMIVKWFVIVAMIGLVDVTLITLWLVLLIGYNWP
jgi:hypothetical protein